MAATRGRTLGSRMKYRQANLQKKDAYSAVFGLAKRVCKAIHITITTNNLESIRIF